MSPRPNNHSHDQPLKITDRKIPSSTTSQTTNSSGTAPGATKETPAEADTRPAPKSTKGETDKDEDKTAYAPVSSANHLITGSKTAASTPTSGRDGKEPRGLHTPNPSRRPSPTQYAPCMEKTRTPRGSQEKGPMCTKNTSEPAYT